ncbi:MAG: hypothetical protein MI974_15610 [Chitinophagales bacterium]|nr:hypothetical protein [Chitinophagales bacterium]
MKKIFLTLCISFLGLSIFAQSVPQGMKYQAVARDHQGQILANQQIGLLIELLLDNRDKEVAYSESHLITTNELGLFDITIGEGQLVRGSFSEVPWNKNEIWMQIGLDENRNGQYTTINSSKLLAVPYAFHAGTADELSKKDNEGGDNRNGGIYWHILGNSGTVPGITFIGTTDFKDFVMKTNNIEAMRISATQEIEMSSDLSVGNNALIGNDLDVTNNADVGNDLDVMNDAMIGNDLTVTGIARFNNTTESTTKDNGAVIIEGGVGIEKNTNIGGNADVVGTLDVDGLASVYAGLRVQNNSSTILTGILNGQMGVDFDQTLNVDGQTDLNSALNVNNMSATYLSGDLTVDGIASFKSQFTIDATITGSQSDQPSYPMLIKGSQQGLAIQVTPSWSNEFLDSGRGNNYISFWTASDAMTGRIEGMTRADLDPTGLLSLVGDLIKIDVTNINESPDILGSLSLPSFSSSSFIDDILGSLVTSVNYSNPGSSSFDPGSLTSNVTGALGDPIGGFISSFNGINGTTPANALWTSVSAELCDPNGIFVQGAGQEAVTNWKSQIFSNYTLDVLQQGISTIANLITLITSFASVLDPEDIFEKTVSILADVINLVIYGSYADINIGVAYESGSGDYAEWLERAYIEEDIKAGDIVGVVGGKISKHFTHADRFMAVSTAPIVLGNMPSESEKEADFEKVAFMGQVPVKVQGQVKIGDYILPSGLGDGLAIAVAPDAMRARDYQRIIGVAWDNSTPGQYINLINTAVDLNHNDMGRVIEDMQYTLNQLQLAMQELNPNYQPRLYDVDQPLVAANMDITLSPTHPVYVSSYFDGKTYDSKEALCADVKKALIEEAGVNLDEVPILEFILDNPEQAEEVKPYLENLLTHFTAMKDSFQTVMEAENN